MTLINPTKEELRAAFKEICNRMDTEKRHNELMADTKEILAILRRIERKLPCPLMNCLK